MHIVSKMVSEYFLGSEPEQKPETTSSTEVQFHEIMEKVRYRVDEELGDQLIERTIVPLLDKPCSMRVPTTVSLYTGIPTSFEKNEIEQCALLQKKTGSLPVELDEVKDWHEGIEHLGKKKSELPDLQSSDAPIQRGSVVFVNRSSSEPTLGIVVGTCYNQTCYIVMLAGNGYAKRAYPQQIEPVSFTALQRLNQDKVPPSESTLSQFEDLMIVAYGTGIL